ncbi:MAG: Ni/Fe hydrogenase subunit alpha [Armatimonadota bacterium]|nr:MAG: Ni/Fe hydrogenase subunit alpha [Armatimonadota bacterium]
MRGNSINVDYLARVEGEGSLIVRFRGGQLKEVQFKIFEPPRFFEAFLRGRSYREAPDITARICGICPVAYQMSAVHAMEDAFGISIEEPVRDLRRLIYCGEWIESHVLHIALLHAPDFLGYEDAIQMARDHPQIVQTALKLKKVGNDLVALIGGREIHPINVKVGGFYKVPRRRDLGEMEERLKWARDASIQLAKWTASLPFPDFERDYEFVALRHPEEYPFNEGRLVSNKGLDIAIDDFETCIVEEHVPHSNALHSRIAERGAYLVGPLARFNLNFDRLSPLAQDIAKEVGITPPCRNPFQSIVVRAVETVYACDEALRLIANYTPPDNPAVEAQPCAATGHGCTEAPRGILYHRYRVDEYGTILDARIVPPTAQNQKSIEADLWALVQANADLPQEHLQRRCEQAIRNYDPCISCATHFLKLHVERE